MTGVINTDEAADTATSVLDVLDESMIDPFVRDSDFVKKAYASNQYSSGNRKKKLRITCYGSSSSRTPEKFMAAARSVGYILAKRGHICVNGAGAMGCMGAMNEGCLIGNGDVVGVIHEMFIVDGKDLSNDPKSVFSKLNTTNPDLPRRELIVAGGDDLQERKKLLVEHADALLVLPGGPGTWDELWEMACIKQIGLNNKELPIVCVNVDGYYNPFQEMLEKAAEEGLLYTQNTADIVHFEPTPEAAIRYIETKIASSVTTKFEQQIKVKKRMNSFLKKRLSYLSDHPPVTSLDDDTNTSTASNEEANTSNSKSKANGSSSTTSSWDSLPVHIGIVFITGVLLGMSLGNSSLSRK